MKETAASLTSGLNSRNRDIISRRFGLKTGDKETLESIGQSYGITRERVRQIEEASLKQIRAGAGLTKVKPFVDLTASILDEAGGVLKEKNLFAQFFNAAEANSNTRKSGLTANTANAALTFALILDGTIQRFAEDESFHTFWALSKPQAEAFTGTVTSLVKAFAKAKAPVAESALTDFCKKIGLPSRYLSSNALLSMISVSRLIGKNIFGNVGLASWAEVKPRGVRDKSYLVLRRESKPKHFREIAQLINVTFNDRRANVQTVHNELIKDQRFVLVGRGMYGLAEWGYKAGTVKDVLIDIMRAQKGPMSRQEIVAQVLNHRLVKENTVILNLQDSRTFKRTDSGH